MIRNLARLWLILACAFSAAEAGQIEESVRKGTQLLAEGYNFWDVGKMKQGRDALLSAEKLSQGNIGCRYHVAYADYLLTLYYMKSDPKTAALHLDEAGALLDALVKDGDRSMKAEALALRSSCMGLEIALSGGQKGQILGQKIAEYDAKAHELDTSNPRVNLLSGQNLLFTPAQWGGGPDKALPFLQEAIRSFEKENVTDSLRPSWGREDSYLYLGMAYRMKGEKERATQSLETALKINPQYGYAIKTLSDWKLEDSKVKQ